MIAAIVDNTNPSGVVPVLQFQVAANAAAALLAYVNAFVPAKNPADFLAFDPGWPSDEYVKPSGGSAYEWAYDFDSPGLVERVKTKYATDPVYPPNVAQVFWDQSGVSPMVGTTSAQSMMAPYPGSKGVTGWWVWWGYPPAVGAQYRLRLYRHRNDPGFTYTQISDAFDITDSLTTYDLFDLTSYLRSNAADFDEAKNDVLALSVVITGGTTQLRALTQRVQFGLPDAA